jgi:hypothetical protein
MVLLKRGGFVLVAAACHSTPIFAAGHKISNKALGEWTNAKFNNSAYALTIGRLLKRKASVIAVDVGILGASKCMRKAQCPKLEATTLDWYTRMEEKTAALSDDLLVAAARRLYELLPSDIREKELQFSSGWIEKFKRRYNIKDYVCHGEDASSDTSASVLVQMENIKAIVFEYDVSDVFNMDETGLFYRLEPNRTLATKTVSGKKKQKDHITVALIANGDGSICLLPLVINKYCKP